MELHVLIWKYFPAVTVSEEGKLKNSMNSLFKNMRNKMFGGTVVTSMGLGLWDTFTFYPCIVL